MTTIAFKRPYLAADRLVCYGDKRDSYITKIHRTRRGALLIAAAGSLSKALAFRDWVETGMKGPSPYLDSDLGNGFIVTPEHCICFAQHGHFLLNKDRWTVGSGGDLAAGALDGGKSAEEAVRIACERDIYSGGEVDVLVI